MEELRAQANATRPAPAHRGVAKQKFQAGLRACEGHEGLHLPMPRHSGVSKASLAYRCGGSAGLIT